VALAFFARVAADGIILTARFKTMASRAGSLTPRRFFHFWGIAKQI